MSEGDAVPIGDAVVRILAPDETEREGAGPEPTAGKDTPRPIQWPNRALPGCRGRDGPAYPGCRGRGGPG